MVDLRVAARLPVTIEIEVAAPLAEVEKARQVPDRRVEPDVEIFAGLARDLESEIGRITRDIPVTETRVEPLGELGGDGRLQAPRARPLAEHLLEGPEPKEEVLRFALHGPRPGEHRYRVDQIGGRVGVATHLAGVAVLVERAAAWAGAAHVSIRQEHLRLFVIGLADRLTSNVSALAERQVHLLGELATLRRVR